jgi:hypothetical protein
MQAENFNALAMDVYAFQYSKNPVYRQFCDLVGRTPDNVNSLDHVPFLPVELFKSHVIKTDKWKSKLIFRSSGTTDQNHSVHHIRSPELYRKNSEAGFTSFYGDPSDYVWLALLPSYIEQPSSSLIFMIRNFISASKYRQSGFYLDSDQAFIEVLRTCFKQNLPVILFGVTFALLDLAERQKIPLKNTLVMETGGMKGRRLELTREDVHQKLKDSFSVEAIHSEYGMTELLSQAWSQDHGVFYPTRTLRITTRDITDPFKVLEAGKRGAICCVDLANLDSASFIATDDLGICYSDGSFMILGRVDNSDLRGCNLMIGEVNTIG